MSEQNEAGAVVTRDEFDRFLENMSAKMAQLDDFQNFSEKLDTLMAVVDKLPAQKKAGFVTDGEDKETNVKSFGDFLLAIKRNDRARLAKVYNSTKDLAGTVGGSGGYIVPVDMRTDLLMIDPNAPRITSLVRRVPTSSLSGSYPVLDQFITPTAGAGDTALAAGLTPATTAENAAMSEDNITFEQLEWRVKKIGGYVDVPNELTADAPALETLLRDLFRIAIDSKLERHILRGAGGGQPVGIMNAACTVAVTTATNNVFAEADALAMLARFIQVGNEPVWVMHRSVIPDLASFTASDRDLVEWRGGMSSTLLGYPIIYSQHMDQANNNDVLLADFSAYLLFDRQDLMIDFSEHAKFESDQGVWRYKVRVDGMPWMKAAITDASPQGSFTQSAFVYHDD